MHGWAFASAAQPDARATEPAVAPEQWRQYLADVYAYRISRLADLQKWYDQEMIQLEIWHAGCLRQTGRGFCDAQMDISEGIVRDRYEREQQEIEAQVQAAVRKYEDAMQKTAQTQPPDTSGAGDPGMIGADLLKRFENSESGSAVSPNTPVN